MKGHLAECSKMVFFVWCGTCNRSKAEAGYVTKKGGWIINYAASVYPDLFEAQPLP